MQSEYNLDINSVDFRSFAFFRLTDSITAKRM